MKLGEQGRDHEGRNLWAEGYTESRQSAENLQIVGEVFHVGRAHGWVVVTKLTVGREHLLELALGRLDVRVAEELHRYIHFFGGRREVIVGRGGPPRRVIGCVGDAAEVDEELEVQLALLVL